MWPALVQEEAPAVPVLGEKQMPAVVAVRNHPGWLPALHHFASPWCFDRHLVEGLAEMDESVVGLWRLLGQGGFGRVHKLVLKHADLKRVVDWSTGGHGLVVKTVAEVGVILRVSNAVGF